MGECLISRRGGEVSKLPTLNPDYPADITKIAAANSTATFSISITEHGKPEQYSYQWYVNGNAVAGAINSSYTMNTTAADSGTYIIYCKLTNKAGVVNSRAATLIVKNPIPVMSGTDANLTFTPASACELKADDAYNWTLKIKDTGLLTLLDPYDVDIFLQGGGGGGGPWTSTNDMGWGHGGGGGAGGYQTTRYAITLNGSYDATIGAGGPAGSNGGQTSLKNSTLSLTANGGKGSTSQSGATGGTAAGGTGGGYYGDGVGGGGGDGAQGKQAFGSGDIYYGAGGGGEAGTFGEPEGAGGTTGGGNAPGGNATANTGSGGAGSDGKGGSGIIIIRNAR